MQIPRLVERVLLHSLCKFSAIMSWYYGHLNLIKAISVIPSPISRISSTKVPRLQKPTKKKKKKRLILILIDRVGKYLRPNESSRANQCKVIESKSCETILVTFLYIDICAHTKFHLSRIHLYHAYLGPNSRIHIYNIAILCSTDVLQTALCNSV